jgi:hypothetical protein
MLAAAVGLECWYAAVAAAADASFKVEAGSDMYMEMSQLKRPHTVASGSSCALVVVTLDPRGTILSRSCDSTNGRID